MSRLRIMSDEEFQAWWREAKRFNLSRWLRWKREAIELWFWHICHPKYTTTNAMGEISGFGGSYELACRGMLKAGLYWLDNNPEADPQFRGYKNVYGIIDEENNDAKTLSDAIMEPVADCSGAMHQAVISRLMWIKKHSWDDYVKETTEHQAEEKK